MSKLELTNQDGNDLDELKTIYDGQFEDLENLMVEPIDLNPRYYMHFAVLNLQKCLAFENLKEGIIRFNLMVTHIEIIAKAANLIPDQEKYENELKKIKKKSDEIEMYYEHRLANKKLQLLLKEVFMNREMRTAMKLKSKNVTKKEK